MLKVFVGYEPRQPLAFNVLQHSIQRHAKEPVAIIPLMLHQLPITRRGLTEFTYSRFLVPWLSGFTYQSVFMDADVVVRSNIAELFECIDLTCAVQVMQEQAKFEWASVMLFNNAKCLELTPDFIDDEANALFDFAWADRVGTLPPEWNHCVGYAEPEESKLYHYTQGIPYWYETRGLVEDAAWFDEYAYLAKTVSWRELMGGSVHAKPVMRRVLQRMGLAPSSDAAAGSGKAVNA